MEDVVAHWLIGVLPPESGPILLGWAHAFPEFRVTAIILGMAVLGLTTLTITTITKTIWRAVR